MSCKRRRNTSRPAAPAQAPVAAAKRRVFSDTPPDYSRPLPPTYSEIKKMYVPARTLAVPQDSADEVWLAADARIEACGGYTLLQHAFSMGQPPLGAKFIGYPALQELTQNALVSACINTVADDITRNWIDVTCGDGESDEEGKQDDIAVTESAQAFDLQSVFHDAAGMSGFFGGCLVFVDTGETDPGRLLEPLIISEKSAELANGGLKGFRVIDPINCFPGSYNSNNPLRDDYYVPQTWWCLSQQVHASRVIHITSGLPPILLRPSYNFFGIPHAQVIYDYVLHFQECRLAAQRLLTKFSRTVLKTDMMAFLERQGGIAELDNRIRMIERYASNDAVIAIDNGGGSGSAGEDILNVSAPIAGVWEVVKQSLELIAAVNRTPAVKILGISPSGFNATGESDLRNYYDHISSKQEQMRCGIQTALEAIAVSTLGKIPDKLSFKFLPLGEDDKLQKATIQKMKMDTYAVGSVNGYVSPEEVRTALAADSDSPFFGIDPESLPEEAAPDLDDERVDVGGGTAETEKPEAEAAA